jgi:hypothetical protein
MDPAAEYTRTVSSDHAVRKLLENSARFLFRSLINVEKCALCVERKLSSAEVANSFRTRLFKSEICLQ